MIRSIKRSIDNEQAKTVEEHFKMIMDDNSFIDTEPLKVITPDDLPDWFDEKLFKQGQDYFKKNILGINTAYLCGLIAVFLVPSIAKMLVYTKQSSTPCAAFKRYFETLLHLNSMQTSDVLNGRSKFYRSLNTIRWRHWAANKRALDNKLNGITQKEMVLTQFGFVGYFSTKPELFGLTDELGEKRGFHHYWRVVGHLLGIPERLNICRTQEYETTQLCKIITDEVYKKNLQEPSPEFMQLLKDTIEGLQCVDPAVDFEAFLKFFYEVNDDIYKKPLGLYSTANYMYRKTVFYLFDAPIIGGLVRSYWNTYLRFTYWFFERYPVIAWWRYGIEKSTIKLYPYSNALGAVKNRDRQTLETVSRVSAALGDQA